MTNVHDAVSTRARREGPTAAAPAGRRGAAVAVVALSAATSAALAVRHIGTKPLWRDEAISLSVAERPVTRILLVLPHHDANAGLYYLLLHGWLGGGTSAAWARGLSALCLILTAAVAAGAGWWWRGWETGVATGLLIAVNPFLLYYGQEARPYALAVLLAVIATVALFALAGPRPRATAASVFVVAAVGAVYADLFAAVYLGALIAAVAAAAWRRRQPPPTGLTRATAAVAAATAPLAVVMVVFERGQISWLGRPSLSALTATVSAMGDGHMGLAVVAALAVVALAASRHRPGDGVVVAALATAAVVPPVALWAAAQVVPVFIDRYVICSTLAVVGVAVAGLAALRARAAGAGRALAGVALGVLVIAGGARIVHLEGEPFKVDNGPAVVGFIQTGAEPGDAVAYAGGGLRILVDASRGRALGAFPPDVALAAGGEALRQDDLYAREVSAAVLASRLTAVRRLWLITDPSDQRYPLGGPFSQLKGFVMSTFTPARTASFGTIDVTLLVRG